MSLVWQLIFILVISLNIEQFHCSSVNRSRTKAVGATSRSRTEPYNEPSTSRSLSGSKSSEFSPDSEDDTETDDSEDDQEGSGSGDTHDILNVDASDQDSFSDPTSGCSSCADSEKNPLGPPRNLSYQIEIMLRHNKCRKFMHLYWQAPAHVNLTALTGFDLSFSSAHSPNDCSRLLLKKSHKYTNETVFTYKYNVPLKKRPEEFTVWIRSIPCSGKDMKQFPPILPKDVSKISDTCINEEPRETSTVTEKQGELPIYTYTQRTETSEKSTELPLYIYTQRTSEKSVDPGQSDKNNSKANLDSVVDIILVTSLVSVVLTVIAVVVVVVVVRIFKHRGFGSDGYATVQSTSPHGSRQCIVDNDSLRNYRERSRINLPDALPIAITVAGKSLWNKTLKKPKSHIAESV